MRKRTEFKDINNETISVGDIIAGNCKELICRYGLYDIEINGIVFKLEGVYFMETVPLVRNPKSVLIEDFKKYEIMGNEYERFKKWR